jgi:hypothetical protein
MRVLCHCEAVDYTEELRVSRSRVHRLKRPNGNVKPVRIYYNNVSLLLVSHELIYCWRVIIVVIIVVSRCQGACAFRRNHVGGTNGAREMRRGEERCLRESDGPFDVMYVRESKRYTKGRTPSPLRLSLYNRTHAHVDVYIYTSEQMPSYYPAHLTLIRDAVLEMWSRYFYFFSYFLLAFHKFHSNGSSTKRWFMTGSRTRGFNRNIVVSTTAD